MSDPSQSPTDRPAPRGVGADRAKSVRAALRRVRETARALLVTRAVARILAVAIWVLIAASLADFLLRMPGGLRTILLVVGLAFLVGAVWRFVLPASRFRPRLADLAIRLERALEPKDRGLLSSAVELDKTAQGNDLTAQLSRRVVEDGVGAFEVARRAKVIRFRPAGLALGHLGLAALVVIVFAVSMPSASKTAAARWLAPWSDASWPRRTELADNTRQDPHASDLSLPVRAIVVRAPGDAERASVAIRYRVVADGDTGPWREAVLTSQRRTVATDDGREGALFERLIEPEALASRDGGERMLEYQFRSGDDETTIGRITVVDPPRLVSANATITAPAYATDLIERGGFTAGADIDLGDGADERSILGRVLAGSRVDLEMTFSKPIVGSTDATPSWLAPVAAAAPDARVAFEESESGTVVRISGELTESLRLPIEAEDEFGLPIREEPTLSIDIVQDAVPTVTVTEPARDEVVLATAVIDLQAEARDDLGIASLVLRQKVARPTDGSIGAAPEAGDGIPPVVIAEFMPSDGVTSEAVVGTALDLATLGVTPGDEIWIDAVAQDILGQSFGADADLARVPITSTVRRLRVIAESELIERIRSQLAGVRRAAMRLDERQGELIEAGDGSVEGDAEQEAGPQTAQRSPAERRQGEQGSLTERIGSQLEAIRELARRQQRNGLEDGALEGLLDEAQDLLNEAAAASGSAAQALAEAAQASPQGSSQSGSESGGQQSGDQSGQQAGQESDEDAGLSEQAEQREQEAREAQQEVRDRLGDLVSMLDRGEDGWLARRSVERLIQDQQRLLSETTSAGRDTVGRELDELTEDERTTLERIADRQRELSRRASEALDELSDRGDALEDADRAQADALRRAAEAGRDNEVSEQLQQAAEQIGQNQTGQAQRSQEQALEALQEMLDTLENAEQQRDESLRRTLADLAQAIGRLIGLQEDAINAFADDPQAEGLDRGMITIHEGTLAALELAGGGFAELNATGEALELASRAQIDAIRLLRTDRGQAEAIETAERESLRQLERALEEAERQQEQAENRERDRKRRELRQAYREALEEQVALREETAGVVDRELNRRERLGVRSIGQKQASLRERVAELPDAYEELAEAAAFGLAHQRLDRSMGGAESDLGRGVAEAGTLALQDGAIGLLSSLVEALAQDNQQQDEFQSGGGGGGGGGGQQPQGLVEIREELKVVRSMQREVATLTRAAEESGTGRAGGLDAAGLSEYQSTIAETLQGLLERASQQNQSGGGSLPAPTGGAE